jgi:dihydrofolate reductase
LRKIVLMMSVSLDGFFADPDGGLDWQSVDEEVHTDFNERLAPMSAFLDGRVTYELMVSYWPNADADPESPAPIVEFARIWRDMPKVVYSRTLDRADWNTTVVRDVVPAEVLALKALPGGDMAVGGADLAGTFLRHGLVDELLIYVHPVVLGRGRPLFPPGVRLDLALVGTKTFGNGVVLLHYERP